MKKQFGILIEKERKSQMQKEAANIDRHTK
jgi:hypothetical protein